MYLYGIYCGCFLLFTNRPCKNLQNKLKIALFTAQKQWMDWYE